MFTEFPPVSTEKWEEVINKDLKGADYEKKLVWRTIEGFKVKPYYRAEDLESLEYLETNPAEAPFVRGKQADGNVWDIREDVKADTLEKANALALDALNRGANSIGFCTCKVDSVEKMQTLLKDIHPEACKINFTCGKNMLEVLKMFVEVVKAGGYDPAKVQGSCNYDIYGHALKKGHFRHGEEGDLEEAVALIKYAKENLPGFRVLAVGGSVIHNAGSNIVQELGFTLAAGNELMARLTERGVAVEEVAKNMVFNFATGSTYFMEIAKIRAARLLGQTALYLFTIGIVAAAFSSADSAMTSLTTCFCVDLMRRPDDVRLRRWVHPAIGVCFFLFIMLVKALNNTSVIDAVYTVCSYTYGPLLGLFSFGLLTKRMPRERWVPLICVCSPLICYAADTLVFRLTGYKFGYELLMCNGLLTFLLLLLSSAKLGTDDARGHSHV